MERNDLVELFEAITPSELHQVKQLLEKYDIEYLVFDEHQLQTGGAYIMGQAGARIFVNPREKREARELLVDYGILPTEDINSKKRSSTLVKAVLGAFVVVAILLVLLLILTYFM